MSITLYGLKNCDTCKKALTALDAVGKGVTFVDIRAQADLAAKVPTWLKTVASETLINTRSTTWRGLDAGERAKAETDPAALLIANPTVIKRPVIESDDGIHVGWSKDVQGALL